MTKLPIILDDLIEDELQNQIEDSMFDCRWEFMMDNCFGSKTSECTYRKFLSPFNYDISPAFISNFLIYKNNEQYKKILPLIKKSTNKIKFNIEKIERCYGAIHAITRDTSKIDNIHINRQVPHLVMLYYVNDSDGDTILYDKVLGDIPPKFNLYPDDYFKFNIVHRINPKRGRLLFFDGRVYHASSSPTKSVRCIITLDLFGEFEDGSYKFPASKIKIKKTNILYQ
jgi:hypothetical protein